VEPPSCRSNTEAGPKNISRHSRHKWNSFLFQWLSVRGLTRGKCGLFHNTFAIE